MTSLLTRNLTDEEVEAFGRDGMVVATGLVPPPAARTEVPGALGDVAARLLATDDVWTGARAEPAPGWLEVACGTGPDTVVDAAPDHQHLLLFAVLDAVAAGRPLRLLAGSYRWRERTPEAGRPAMVRWFPEVGDVLAVRAGTIRQGPLAPDADNRGARSAQTAASRVSAAVRTAIMSSLGPTGTTSSR